MTTAGGYSASADALAELASAFKVNADAMSVVTLALEGAEAGLLAFAWGEAGRLAKIAYEADSQVAILNINLLATTLGTVGDAVAALAMQYGANESDTAGLFDQIM